MRTAALSLAKGNFTGLEAYRNYLHDTLSRPQNRGCGLVVLPAHTGLLLALGCGRVEQPPDLVRAYAALAKTAADFNAQFLQVHAGIASYFRTYLIDGTTLEAGNDGNIYLTAHLFSPDGELIGRQRQTHLTREEEKMKLSPGSRLPVFATPYGKIGILIGTDAYYPETGRILALQGADIVCHCGALPEKSSPWQPLAGMWAQVQQNQFFALESQLAAEIAGNKFAAPCAVLAPCEMTPGQKGYLAWGEKGEPAIVGELDFDARREVIAAYPILNHLNPAAYRGTLPEIYGEGGREE